MSHTRKPKQQWATAEFDGGRKQPRGRPKSLRSIPAVDPQVTAHMSSSTEPDPVPDSSVPERSFRFVWTRTPFTLENGIHCFGVNVKTVVAMSLNSQVNVGDDVTHAQSFNVTQSRSSRRSQLKNLKLPSVGRWQARWEYQLKHYNTLCLKLITTTGQYSFSCSKGFFVANSSQSVSFGRILFAIVWHLQFPLTSICNNLGSGVPQQIQDKIWKGNF